MNTVTFTVAPAQPDRRVNTVKPMVDPLTKQDEDFSKVWLAMRNQTMMLGPGRPLICAETMAENHNFGDY